MLVKAMFALATFLLSGSWVAVFTIIFLEGKLVFGEPDPRILLAELAVAILTAGVSLYNLVMTIWGWISGKMY